MLTFYTPFHRPPERDDLLAGPQLQRQLVALLADPRHLVEHREGVVLVVLELAAHVGHAP